MIDAVQLPEKLNYFVTEIEKLEDEKDEVREKSVLAYSDAKSSGLDTKALKQLIKERKIRKEELEAQEGLIALYRSALSMIRS